jgi:cytochrome b561
MSLVDNRDSYGWISIILHWLSAGAVLFLWFVGQSAALAESDEARLPLLNLHVSVALFVASLIIVRVLWRVLKGHPDVVNFARERVIFKVFPSCNVSSAGDYGCIGAYDGAVC